MPIPMRSWRRRGASTIPCAGLDEAIVFDPVTGETHFLSDLPLLLLSVVGSEPLELKQIVARLTPDGGLDAESERRVDLALAHLAQAELVEYSDWMPD